MQGDPGQQKVGERGLAVKQGSIKKGSRTGTEAARLKMAPFVEQEKGLVKIEKPGPDEIFFLREHFARLCKQFKGLHSLPLLAISDGFVREGLRGLVTHVQFLKAAKSFVRHFARLLAQVQLEVDVGEVEVAKSEMIRIADGLAGAASRIERLDCAAVFPAQVVQVGNVVVGLRDQQGHAVLFADRAGSPVGGECPGKVVQADEADGHVAENHSHGLVVLVRRKALIGPLVMREGFLESILAVIDVADVDFEPRQAEGLIEPGENIPRPVRGIEGAVIFAKKNQRLDGGAQRAGGLVPDAQRGINLKGLFVMLDGGAIVARDIESIGLGAEAEGNLLFASQAAPDRQRSFGKPQGILGVDPSTLDNQLRELPDDLGFHQRPVPSEEFSTLRLRADARQFRKEFFRRRLLCSHRGH